MKNYALPVAIRFLVFVAPLFLLHLYLRSAVEYAHTQEHHGDTGLGIAILLAFTTLFMLGGFLVDLIIQIRMKRPHTALTDAFIVLMLLMPFGWVACNWFGAHHSLACTVPIMFFGQVLSWFDL